MFERRQPAAGDWVKCELALARIAGEWREDDPLRLDDLKVIRYRETDARLYFMAQLEKDRSCECGAPEAELKKNGMTSVLKIKDLPIHNKRTVIYYRAQRYLCPTCGKTMQSVSDEISENHRMTQRLFEYVRRESLSTFRTFRDVADEVGVQEHVVRNIFTDHVERLQRTRVIRLPKWIAMDEVKPTSRRVTRCVISAPLEGEVMDILCDNNEAVKLFFQNLKCGEQVEVVSMDMWEGYRVVIRRYLSHVEIVIDRYHIQKLVNEAFKDVLAVVRTTLTPAQYKEYMCRESFLLEGKFGPKKSVRSRKKSPKVSPEAKKRALDLIFEKLPDVAEAYALKEDFAAILNLWDYDEARERMLAWLERVRDFAYVFYKKHEKKCRRLLKRPFGNIHGTVTKWFDEILNYVKFKSKYSKKVTNAYAENLNRKIRRLNELGYGYNFEVLRAKVVFGGVMREHVPPDPLAERRKRGVRRRPRRAGVSPDSNVRRLIRAYEDSMEIPRDENDPALEAALTSRLPIEIVSDPYEEEDPLERRTRYSQVNMRFKEGVIERLHGDSEKSPDPDAPRQADLFSLLSAADLGENSASGEYPARFMEDDKHDDGDSYEAAQPSLF